jgi:hypothetical protein
MTGAERRRRARPIRAFLAFEPLVNFERRLAEQEQSADDENQSRPRCP